jgi:DivIVA domain-containing protein
MAVSPQQLRSLRFDEGIRGYDKRQVDKVIQRVADLVEDLENRLADAERRAGAGGSSAELTGEAAELDETLRRTLVLAQRTADAAIKEAKEEATRLRTEARAEADELVAEARARHAEVATEVEAERTRLLAEARQDCEERVARVQAELSDTHEAMRAELVEQVQQLTQVRDLLTEDIERLEAHVEVRRQQVRAALAELGAVLDDPDKLHGVVPSLAELDPAVGGEGYEPVAVEVGSLAELAPPTDGLAEGEAGGDPADVGDGPPTALHPVVDGGADAGSDAPGTGDDDEPARPAWADAVPPASGDDDEPVLAGQTRAGTGTGQDGATMERFFSESDEDRRSGWFRRKG